jgi:hypothetical protein
MAIVLCRGENSAQNLFIDHYLLKSDGESGTQFRRKTAVENKIDNFQ